jgi:hypothetical protein
MESENMDYEKYLKERLQGQINWYSKRSIFNKRVFLWLSTIEIICASSIPFLVGYVTDNCPWVKILVGFLGVLIAVITGITALNKSQELWIEYRTTCESLKHQRYLFETGTKPYDEADAFHLLAENVENLISREHSKWSRYTKEKRKEEEKKEEQKD